MSQNTILLAVLLLVISNFSIAVISKNKFSAKASVSKSSKNNQQLVKPRETTEALIECIKCHKVDAIIYNTDRASSFMNGHNLIRDASISRAKLRMCKECYKNFHEFINRSLRIWNSSSAEGIFSADPIVLAVLIDGFVDERFLYLNDVLQFYSSFDKFERVALETFFHQDFEGDIHEMRENAKKLLEMD